MTSNDRFRVAAFALLAVGLASLALTLHGCSATPVPIASSAECSAAGWPENIWHGQTSLRCPSDPTAYPVDPAGNIVHFEARRDAGSDQ